MEFIVQWIVSLVIAVTGGGLASYFLMKSQIAKSQAETSRIYQQMALAETAERERLEARFEAQIEALHKNRTALEARLLALRAELDALKIEKEDWQKERKEMLGLIADQECKIKRLQQRIRELEKKQTGQL